MGLTIMPNFATLSLPAGVKKHDFTPDSIVGNVATLVESQGIPIGANRLSFSKTVTANGRIKSTWKLSLPIVQDQVVNGISKKVVVRTAYADLTFSFDGSSEKLERADARAVIEKLMSSDDAQRLLDDLQTYY